MLFIFYKFKNAQNSYAPLAFLEAPGLYNSSLWALFNNLKLTALHSLQTNLI